MQKMKKEKLGFFGRLKKGLGKSNASMLEKISYATRGKIKIDDEMLEELEEALITADIGMKTTAKLIATLKAGVDKKEVSEINQISPFIQKEICKIISVSGQEETTGTPHVILMIGVNGAGKTTTIGKLANHYQNEGKEVLLGAGDTFRAAAIEQLDEWCKRIGCGIVKHHPNSDPSAVAFDTIKAGVARKKDIVIIDTAGRLHTRTNLMEQLIKIKRVISRELEGAPHETLLVIDGTTGQNAINQVKEFSDAVGVTGLVLTKLDGTSRGGAVVGVVGETGIPVKFIGIGEKIDDLQAFNPELFAKALLEK